MRRLILFGCGNFARMAHHFFVHDSEYEVAAFTVDGALQEADTFLGLPVVPFEEVVERLDPQGHDLFVAAGLREVNRRRAAKVREAREAGYSIASYVSSRAVVSEDFRARENTWVMETAHLHPTAELGRNCIVWSRSTIGFNSSLADDCWVSGGLVGESVTVGEGTFIGLGATIASFTAVGARNVIGAGALILKDTADEQVFRGTASEASAVPSSRFLGFNG
ncbi:MAG: transferase [Planctomycetota bacterium]|jgi:sugar O-acyltransferase (sialic acid O-acetyltransferase NeuD family)|nr:transferase [Planctomycetota bacterium]MDP6989408.1 transferase [Planctomycetota bacterium]